MRKFRITGVLLALCGLLVSGVAQAAEVIVYKSPTCDCCGKWMQHLRDNGFNVKSRDVENLTPYKIRFGVSPELASCHTAVVEGYAIEGHVPAADIKRLLKERPKVKGLAVPGMPTGSPGMEGPNPQRYEVLTFDERGNTKVFARH